MYYTYNYTIQRSRDTVLDDISHAPLSLTLSHMSTNKTTPDAAAPKKSWENMSTPSAKPMTSGDDTKKTGDLPKDPQPKTDSATPSKKY
jgi:hypothetical protein